MPREPLEHDSVCRSCFESFAQPPPERRRGRFELTRCDACRKYNRDAQQRRRNQKKAREKKISKQRYRDQQQLIVTKVNKMETMLTELANRIIPLFNSEDPLLFEETQESHESTTLQLTEQLAQ